MTESGKLLSTCVFFLKEGALGGIGRSLHAQINIWTASTPSLYALFTREQDEVCPPRYKFEAHTPAARARGKGGTAVW